VPRTPDRTPGPSIEEELQLEDNASDPSVVGGITQNAGVLKGRDSVGVFDLRSGTGLSESAHKTLRHLIHFIDDGPAGGFASGAYKETLPSASVFPTSEIWWESSSKLKKIVELTTTWAGSKITAEEWKMYDTDGSTVLVTVTDAISYSGVFETTRTRTIA
jgi:hypothetical protein